MNQKNSLIGLLYSFIGTKEKVFYVVGVKDKKAVVSANKIIGISCDEDGVVWFDFDDGSMLQAKNAKTLAFEESEDAIKVAEEVNAFSEKYSSLIDFLGD